MANLLFYPFFYILYRFFSENSLFGDGRDRTDDLLRAKQAFYQLNYTPILIFTRWITHLDQIVQKEKQEINNWKVFYSVEIFFTPPLPFQGIGTGIGIGIGIVIGIGLRGDTFLERGLSDKERIHKVNTLNIIHKESLRISVFQSRYQKQKTDWDLLFESLLFISPLMYSNPCLSIQSGASAL